MNKFVGSYLSEEELQNVTGGAAAAAAAISNGAPIPEPKFAVGQTVYAMTVTGVKTKMTVKGFKYTADGYVYDVLTEEGTVIQMMEFGLSAE